MVTVVTILVLFQTSRQDAVQMSHNSDVNHWNLFCFMWFRAHQCAKAPGPVCSAHFSGEGDENNQLTARACSCFWENIFVVVVVVAGAAPPPPPKKIQKHLDFLSTWRWTNAVRAARRGDEEELMFPCWEAAASAGDTAAIFLPF